MLKLRKFKEKKLKNNSLLVSAIILLGLMSSVVISKTYAIYKVEKKYDLIQAKIGDFRGKNQVISYYINNRESDVIPENKNYKVNVSCENATGVWNESKWKLELSNITKYTVTCTVNFKEKYVIENAKSTNNSIIANYSNIENISTNYYLYGTDKNNLNEKNNEITNLNNDTTYYFKKCYEDNNEEICSEVSKLLTAGKVTNFDYTGGEQTYQTSCKGKYKLETWGAQGATDTTKYHGGYGGYSKGLIQFDNKKDLYIYVGGKGQNINNMKETGIKYGYPNGGAVKSDGKGSSGYEIVYSSGGGSSHILDVSKQLSELVNNKELIYMVSGGGGGACDWWNAGDDGGSGGGTSGSATSKNHDNVNSTGGSQVSGGSRGGAVDDSILIGVFGIGGGATTPKYADMPSGGGGGGFYGGGASWGGSGAGGSGYIGNPSLTDKVMYCYNCEESTEVSTKTISTTCTSATPTINCAKRGNGYARITIEECSI